MAQNYMIKSLTPFGVSWAGAEGKADEMPGKLKKKMENSVDEHDTLNFSQDVVYKCSR